MCKDNNGKSKGWEIGIGPSIVIVDKGTARALPGLL
jgi:hypothetical protein